MIGIVLPDFDNESAALRMSKVGGAVTHVFRAIIDRSPLLFMASLRQTSHLRFMYNNTTILFRLD